VPATCLYAESDRSSPCRHIFVLRIVGLSSSFCSSHFRCNVHAPLRALLSVISLFIEKCKCLFYLPECCNNVQFLYGTEQWCVLCVHIKITQKLFRNPECFTWGDKLHFKLFFTLQSLVLYCSVFDHALKTSFRVGPLNPFCGAGKFGKMSGCGQNEIQYAEWKMNKYTYSVSHALPKPAMR
jgi:hypothetical protein